MDIDQLRQAEDMSRLLEEWGLLAAYEHVLTEIAKRRVSIPVSHLYEFAAREFERHGSRMKDGRIDTSREQRKSNYRQRQVSRRIHDTARELRFTQVTQVTTQELEPVTDFLMSGVEDLSKIEQKLGSEEAVDFLMQGVTTKPEPVTDFVMPGVEDLQKIEQALASKEAANFLMQGVTIESDPENVPRGKCTPDVLFDRENVKDQTENQNKHTCTTITDNSSSNNTINESQADEEQSNREDLSSLKVFAPMLLKVIFESLDNKENNSQKYDNPLAYQSSDLSEGSDLSLLSESQENSNIVVLDALNTQEDIALAY